MRQGQGKSRRRIPGVWLMTDERIPKADLLRAVRRLPTGAAVVVRHYGLAPVARRTLFEAVRAAGRRRHVVILLAGDPATAHAWHADGHHGPAPARDWRARRRWLHSAPAHDHHELRRAVRSGADVILLSRLFATRSHPGASVLGGARFAALARLSPVPVIALGGVRPRHRNFVRRLGAAGFAAIDGLTGRRR